MITSSESKLSISLTGSDLWTPTYYFQLDEESLEENKRILKEHLELTSPTSAYSIEDSGGNF